MTSPLISSTNALSDTDAIQLLHDLVATPSPSGEEAAAVGLLVEWMASHGYDNAYIDEAGNAVGIIGSGTRDIVLLGHIDTFTGNPPVFIRDNVLYGRGSVDAKGSLCTFAIAAARAQLAGDVRLIVIGAVEEEAPTSKGARYAATQWQPQMCLIGEPSGWDRMTLGYKGRLLINWRWDGALAHSAAAVATGPEHAFAYWQQVLSYAETFNQDITSQFARLDPTLQAINSGYEGAYGWAEMTIGFRLPPMLSPDAVARDLSTLAADDVRVRTYGHEQACVAEKDTPLTRALRGAIRAQGGRPRFVYKTGTSDMNIVAPQWGCPIVAYGPGDSSLDHTPDEHLPLDEYLCAINVLTEALSRL